MGLNQFLVDHVFEPNFKQQHCSVLGGGRSCVETIKNIDQVF